MKQIDGAPTTRGILDAAMSEDGAALGALPLARDLARPHAGADGRHRGEPSPFHDGDLVGTVGPICVGSRMRPDAGEAGESAIGKTAVDGPVRVTRTGLVGDAHGDKTHHGGEAKALYVMDAAEQARWNGVLGGVAPGRLGENMLVVPGERGGIDDVELGAILSLGDPTAGGVRVRVTGVRNPCPTFARGVGRADWVEVFSARVRVGVYLSVLTEGVVRTGDEVRVISSPGHRVTCTRWFAHHDPRDAQALLNSEIFGNCGIAPFTRKYVRAAAHEQVG